MSCFGVNRAPTGHPMALRIAAAKHANGVVIEGWDRPSRFGMLGQCFKQGSQPRAHFDYSLLSAVAEAKVLAAIAEQIKLEVRRVLPALPRAATHWDLGPEDAVECKLTRMLVTIELKCAGVDVSSEKEVSGSAARAAATYQRGVIEMAAMCLGFTGGLEEEAFWLLAHVLEDVLGHEYLTKTPACPEYSSDRAVTAAIVAAEAPLLTARLGPRGLAEAVALLSQRCLLSGFVEVLADEPLLAFWEELLAGYCGVYPRLPLVSWVVGLVCAAESALVTELRMTPPQDFAQALCSRVCQVARGLPEGWRPLLRTQPDEFLTVKRLAEKAWQEHLSTVMHHQDCQDSPDGTAPAFEQVGALAEASGATAKSRRSPSRTSPRTGKGTPHGNAPANANGAQHFDLATDSEPGEDEGNEDEFFGTAEPSSCASTPRSETWTVRSSASTAASMCWSGRGDRVKGKFRH